MRITLGKEINKWRGGQKPLHYLTKFCISFIFNDAYRNNPIARNGVECAVAGMDSDEEPPKTS